MTFRADILDDLESPLSDWDDVIWDAATYKGIFHNEFEAALLFSGEIESRDPWVEVREADFSAIDHTDTVTINAVSYKIISKEPSGAGMLLLKLSKD